MKPASLSALRILVRGAVARRKMQPTNLVEIKRILNAARSGAGRLSLAVIWGAQKETKNHKANSSDRKALDRLSETARLLEKAGCMPEIKIIFFDSHAREFNGTPRHEIEVYYQSLRRMAKRNCFEIVRISGLHRKWGLSYDKIKTGNAAINRKVNALWSKNKVLRVLLTEMARKHSRLARERGAEASAKLYAAAHILEDPYLKREFANSIFIAYCRPETQKPLSNLPTLFYCATGRGVGDCPLVFVSMALNLRGGNS